VVRGAHVHADYDEYYTVLQGRLVVGLADIRRDSSTFGRSVQFNWSDRDRIAIVVIVGVAHVVYFETDAMLVFGLSGFWSAESDSIGCQWNAPELAFNWHAANVRRSQWESQAGDYAGMPQAFEQRSRAPAKRQ
jgi:dTDP-4-dehydrorhamnose 3,5-epimerase